MKQKCSLLLSLVIAVFLCYALAYSESTESLKPEYQLTDKSTESLKPQYENTRKLITFVNEAVSQVQMKGEAAFAEFLKPGSKWNHGETYIIVFDLLGNTIVHSDPNEIGKNRSNLVDSNGKPIFKSILATVTCSGCLHWTHYLWPKPEDIFPTWKSTYSTLVQAPSGKEYIVSAGLYNMKMEKMFIVEQVAAASDLIESKGKAAFVSFRDKSSNFFYLNAYIFVIGENGMDVVNPAFPNLEGRNLYNMRDESGKYLFREMIDVAKSKGSGWVEYMWPRPGEIKLLKKESFVKAVKVNDELFIVGSGFYLD
jgi:signal transduction histidine kinase